MKLKYPALLALLSASSVHATNIFVNEIHYDNEGGDVAELVEIAAPAGTDLTGMSVVLYNGSSSQLKPYSTLSLSGVVTDQSGGYGFMTVDGPSTGIQNGGPDGLALVDADGNVLQFLSYEGTFAAAEGAAIGMTSVDIGQNETSSTPVGHSLQLSGSGTVYNDFTWVAPNTATAGNVNTNQSFDGSDVGGDPVDDPEVPVSSVLSGSVCFNCVDLAIEFDIDTFDASTYYSAVDINAPLAELRATLSDTIESNHKFLTYTEVWTALTYTDEDPLDTNNVTLWYSGRSQAKNTNGSGAQSSDQNNWNREHSWPNSHGFPERDLRGFTDIHHLRPTDISINSARGNLDFNNSDAPLGESPINRVDSNSFEPRDSIKGDVARMMFYMDVRYEGTETAVEGESAELTPDIELVNRLTNAGEPALGLLCRLQAWHDADPVDDAESLRNDRIYELQGNRNPFIDNPEWVSAIYGPTTECTVDLGGDDGDTGGGDDGNTGGGDDGGDTTDGNTTSSSLIFINEIHYDNTGADVDEAVEIAGLAGTDLDGLSLVFYNGSNGTSYNPTDLSGVIPDQQSGFGTLSFLISGIQNGGPDGIALVDADDNVLQFLSYEGSFEATNGPASGQTSEDIGVAEAGSSDIGLSLQLTGDGFVSSDFTWTSSSTENFGSINTGQNFVAPTPFINEIHYDNSGGDVDEGFEIAGLAGIDLTGLSLVLYNGSNGTSYNTTALSGVLPNQQNGFGTLSFPISGIQNGAPDGVALVDAFDNVLQFLSYEGSLTATDGPAEEQTSEDIGVAETSSAAVGSSLQLTGNGFRYTDFAWAGSSTGNFGDINTDQAFGSSDGDSDGGSDDGSDGGVDVALGVCADPATLIHAVQGTSDVSPVVGQTLVVEAVVTAAFAPIGGFYLQEEDAQQDADAASSEGLFIAFSGDLPLVGSVVRVVGEVVEDFDNTQMNVTSDWLECGNDSVTPAILSLPFASADSAESLEGMLVTTNQELTVSDNFRLGRFAEVVLSNGRLFTPTNVFLPGSDEAIALEAANSLNIVFMGDASDVQNPEPVVYPTGNLSAVNTLRSGDTVTSVTGVLDFDFGKYLINPTVAPTFVATNPRTAAPDLTLGNLKVGSLNVLNFFNGDGQGAGFPTSRGADSAFEYERQLAKTVEAIVTIDADILGLMEIENDGFDSLSAIAQLAEAVNAAMGEQAYSFVSADGPIGTDDITVGLLYKSSVVNVSGAVDILDSSNSIVDEDGVLFNTLRNRPAMSQKFALTENGEEIVISVNHLKSKGSGCGTGDDDTTTGQGNCNLTRTRAATALVSHLAQNFVDSSVLLIGDLNAYAKEDPITAIESAGFTNLIERFQGSEAYSFTFDGRLGYLDHALGNGELLSKVVDVTEWHINADEPIVLDYNVEFQSDTQIVDLYAADAYRMSDHDPVVISLQLDAEVTAVTGDWDGDGDVDIDDIQGLFEAISQGESIDTAFDLNNDGLVNVFDLQLTYTLCSRVGCAL